MALLTTYVLAAPRGKGPEGLGCGETAYGLECRKCELLVMYLFFAEGRLA